VTQIVAAASFISRQIYGDERAQTVKKAFLALQQMIALQRAAPHRSAQTAPKIPDRHFSAMRRR